MPSEFRVRPDETYFFNCRVYKEKRQMKHIRILFLAALIGMMAVSCNEIEDSYDNSAWSGKYPILTQNGTTGEMEERTGIIRLSFHDGALKCKMMHGIAGMYADMYHDMSLKYDVHWSSGVSFSLTKTTGDQTMTCYTGTISGNKMSLDALSCDQVAQTYVLYKLLEE